MEIHPSIIFPISLAIVGCGAGMEDSSTSTDQEPQTTETPAVTVPPISDPVAQQPAPVANPAPVPVPAPVANPPPVQAPPVPVAEPPPVPVSKLATYEFPCWDRNARVSTIMVYHDASEYPWQTIRIVSVAGEDLMIGRGVGDLRLRHDPDGNLIDSGVIVDRGNGVFATGLEPPRGTLYGPVDDPSVFERPYPTVYFFAGEILQEVRLEWHNQSYNSDLRCFIQ